MKVKQIYFYDGTPYLVTENKNGEMQYPEEQWTDIEPPEGIYTPCHFDGKKWIGNTKENWENSQPKNESEGLTNKYDEKDDIIAELSLELIRTQEELSDVRKDISDLTMQLLGGNANA
ncbi:hypothetical protein K4Q20_06085 [Staphylococcus epidermidis]|nr:hypothetical protein [Staphylococcus epidermidis]MCG1579523.1 hypothetical protein [Staphylococcus epidermidis]